MNSVDNRQHIPHAARIFEIPVSPFTFLSECLNSNVFEISVFPFTIGSE